MVKAVLAGGGMAAAGAGLLAYATVAPGSQIFGPVLVAPHGAGQIALTFDDGPNPAATPQLLDLLARYEVAATFFLIGRYALAERALARRIVAEGHAVGNHTMTHPRLPLCAHGRVRREIEDGQRAIEDVTGVRMRLFRPPHGYRTPYALRVARESGMVTTTWNIIGNDWKLPTAEAIAARVTGAIARNQGRRVASNVVLHDGSQISGMADRRRSVAAAAMLLRKYAAGKARFVTLEPWIERVGPGAD